MNVTSWIRTTFAAIRSTIRHVQQRARRPLGDGTTVSDASPVEADEDVLRRIVYRVDQYDPSLDVPIQRYAFKAMPNDVLGITVWRQRFISARNLAAAGPNQAGYVIAALCVQDIQSIDLGTTRLSVVADPIDDLPGHALIPELNTNTPREIAKEMQVRLARLASRKIVYAPDNGSDA